MNYYEAGNGILLGFPTPILRRMIPNSDELNRNLAKYLLLERDKNPSPSTSAVKGWQSARSLTIRNEPHLNRLFRSIGLGLIDVCSASFGFEVTENDVGIAAEAWGNIQGDRDFTAIHNHVEGTHFSGVYYVQVGSGEDNGVLELIDPRTVQPLTGPGKFRRPNREITIRPTNGLLVIWPSWMKHLVYPINEARERISISFNAKIILRDG
jgi:uncharacterized protein (TIGR02466 family)